MAWAWAWRIDGRRKWAAILSALVDRSSIEFPCEIIVRSERTPIQGWRRAKFHAACSDLAPHWNMAPGEVKQKVKEDFYGAEVMIEKSRLSEAEVAEFQRLLSKIGPYTVVVQSSEDSDDEEYGRLVDHLYLMAADSGVELPDRRMR